jgi:glycosyltransferase involved in cell wall biosynthesis
MLPEVSVIMPVLNGERFIAEAIQSIVDQTFGPCELVVVDDGSTDRTGEIVSEFEGKLPIRRVRHEKPRGIAPSMNDGVRNASGRFITFLDHDDSWMPDFVETQIAALRDHPETGMVHSDFQTIDANGRVLEAKVSVDRGRGMRPSGRVFRELFMDSFIVGNSVMIRKECFDRLGMFDESLRWGDYHMWLRIARHYNVDYVDRVLTRYRQHSTQSTRTVAPGRATGEESVGLAAIRKLLESCPEIRRELGEHVVRRRMANLYMDLAGNWWSQGAFGNARICIGKALRTWPWSPRYYALYAASMVKPAFRPVARG